MVHFNHPRELTDESIHAIGLVHNAGVITANQTPLLRGVNDDPAVLAELFNKLSYIGVAPYYVFIGRPTQGNRHFLIPIEEALRIFEQSRMNCSGLAKRARLVMSHATGKVQILGRTEDHVYMRYHRAADPDQKGRFLVLRSNPEALWLDDYEEVVRDYLVDNPFRYYGPD
jgi:L-lysine 2,3-aminomutase